MVMQSHSVQVVGDESLKLFQKELKQRGNNIRAVKVQRVGTSTEKSDPGGLYLVTWLEVE